MSGTLISILLAIAGMLGLGGMFLKNQRDQRKAGEDAQKARDLDAAMKEVIHANQARASVGDTDVERLLKPPADRK